MEEKMGDLGAQCSSKITMENVKDGDVGAQRPHKYL